MLHTVEIRIVLECWRDGGLIETVLLDSEPLVPADLLVTDLSLQHIAVDWPADLGFEGAADPGQALLAAARAQDRWVPALRIGDALLLDQAYGADCRLEPATEALSTVGKLGGAIGEALGGFGDILGGLGGPPVEAEQAGQVTALWIDYTLSVPGEAPEVVRRQVFDLVGPAARSAGLTDMPILSEEQQLGWRLGLLGSTEILIQASDWSPDFVANRTLRTQIANQEVLLRFLRDPAAGDLASFVEVMADLDIAATPLDALAAARQEWRPHADVYLDRANILSLHAQVAVNQDGLPVALQGIDIVANSIAATASDDRDAFAARLEAGVFDTNAENVRGGCTAVARLLDCREIANTASLFNGAEAEWVAVHSMDELGGLGDLTADQAALIGAAIARGYIAVLPLGRVDESAFAWWRIDPDTGQTLGLSAAGWGAQEFEYLALQTMVMIIAGVQSGMISYLGWQSCSQGGGGVGCYGCVIAGAMLTAAAILVSSPLVAGGIAAGNGPLTAVCTVATAN
jgi:hypothetical protein